MNPLAATGGLGDVAGSLPAALRERGIDVRVIMPLYKKIKQTYRDSLRFIRWSMINLGWRTMYSGLFTMDVGGVPIYFIDNDFYFGHDDLYIDYSFDVERFAFFQRAVLEVMGEPMEFQPDLLHLNDWQTAMMPVLLESHYQKRLPSGRKFAHYCPQPKVSGHSRMRSCPGSVRSYRRLHDG